MYYSEYLRNKKRAAPQVISPPKGRDSSLWTQIQRYKSAGPIVTPLSAGQMLELSADGVIASKGHAAVCCADTITVPTVIAPTCCDLVAPVQYPRGFYGPVRPECCPINGPPLSALISCCQPNQPDPCCLATANFDDFSAYLNSLVCCITFTIDSYTTCDTMSWTVVDNTTGETVSFTSAVQFTQTDITVGLGPGIVIINNSNHPITVTITGLGSFILNPCGAVTGGNAGRALLNAKKPQETIAS